MMEKKNNLRMIIWLFIGVFVCLIYVIFNYPRLSFYLTKNTPENKILISWLIKKDPQLFNRCKVFIGEKDPFYSISKENNRIKISAMICGNIASFWINNKTKTIDCYISYCGKNIGKKFCGKEIADEVCLQ